MLGGLAVSPVPLATAATERSLRVASAGGPRYGRKQYADTLPLADGEIVLTFDDGPLPATTLPILDSLDRAGARAVFFMIGRNARANPNVARRIVASGHTVANHTLNHPWTMPGISFERGVREIEEGRDAIAQATGSAVAPFFRFPGFADTPPLLAELSRRDMSVWGADLWASDWNVMSPQAQLHLLMGRLRRARKGIVLLHDIRAQTAAMLPEFLRVSSAEGFRVVKATV
ncbi:MAG: polysaccharide deacetylase family protein [Beijerinckiaceae bacterium]